MTTSGSYADLDPLRWGILSEMITAAAQGDSNGVHNAASRMGGEVPDDGVAGTYLWFLIHYHVPRLIGHPPTAADLYQLARRIHARFTQAVPPARRDHTLAERALRTFFDFAVEDEQVNGGLLVITGAAALGVMLDNPLAQLQVMKPYLADWWRQNLDDFRDQGLLDEFRRH